MGSKLCTRWFFRSGSPGFFLPSLFVGRKHLFTGCDEHHRLIYICHHLSVYVVYQQTPDQEEAGLRLQIPVRSTSLFWDFFIIYFWLMVSVTTYWSFDHLDPTHHHAVLSSSTNLLVLCFIFLCYTYHLLTKKRTIKWYMGLPAPLRLNRWCALSLGIVFGRPCMKH